MDGMIKGLFIERQRPRLKHDWQSSLFDLYLVVDYKVSGNEYHQDWETFYAAADDSDPVWSGLSYQCDITNVGNGDWQLFADVVVKYLGFAIPGVKSVLVIFTIETSQAVLQQRLSIQAPHVLIIVAQTVKRLTGQCMAVSVQHMYNELSSSKGQGVVPDKIDVSYLMESRSPFPPYSVMLTVSSTILKAPPQFPPYVALQLDQLFPLTLSRPSLPLHSSMPMKS
ncbi:hypothetical protein EDD15DRAFT_2203161 [Pisolithus albus]|nr:hypothetical protein EDD15DRAFT_2206513 [Pisolithus albus]KAI5982162.1 hypothetical protein EDD15DRAFT_2203161 [Pisolithus albus]